MLKQILAAAALAAVLTSCNAGEGSGGTDMRFSRTPRSPENFTESMTLYLNEDMERVTLDGSLTLRGERVTVRVVSPEDGAVEWEGTPADGDEFTVELTNVKADTERVLQVEGVGVERMELRLTSGTKLVPDPPEPERPERRGRV